MFVADPAGDVAHGAHEADRRAAAMQAARQVAMQAHQQACAVPAARAFTVTLALAQGHALHRCPALDPVVQADHAELHLEHLAAVAGGGEAALELRPVAGMDRGDHVRQLGPARLGTAEQQAGVAVPVQRPGAEVDVPQADVADLHRKAAALLDVGPLLFGPDPIGHVREHEHEAVAAQRLRDPVV